MAFEYKGTLIKDPVTGKLRYDNPQALPAVAGAGYMLPKQEQKIIRDVSGLPTMQTTSPYPIHQQPALKMHPKTTLEVAGIPSVENTGVSQGAVPTGIAGYFGVADKRGKIALDPQSGVATGGFAINEQNRLAEVARQDADQKAFWEQVNAGKARETADIKNNLMTRVNSAIASGDYRQAAALTSALQAASGIQPLDMSKQGALDIEKSQVPSKNKLAEAQAGLFGQQAAAIPYNTAIQKYIAEHASKNQPQDFNSKIAALVKAGLDPEQAIALAGIPENATAEQRQQVLNLINERKKG